MPFVESEDDIRENLETMRRHLLGRNKRDLDTAQRLLGRGRNFVAGTLNGRTIFGPSLFMGSQGNTLERHDIESGKPWSTDNKIDGLLDRIECGQPEWEALEGSYLGFCSDVGARPSNYAEGNERTFWNLDYDSDYVDLDGRYTEGRR